MITQARLKELFNYNPDTGSFTWLLKTNRRTVIGSQVGTINRGYCIINVDGKSYKAHRLAFLYMTGSFPINDVDHIDGNKSNNAWVNLRDVFHHQNLQNQKNAKSHNKSGLLGVCWSKKAKKYHAQIVVQGVSQHLGYFDDKESAHQAYLEAKRINHDCNTL